MEETDEMRQLWRSELKRFIFIILINSVLCLAIIAIMYYYGVPLLMSLLPESWLGVAAAIVTLSICSPFLWSLMRQGGNSANVNRLWQEGGKIERVKMTALGLFRLAVGAAFIAYIVGNTLPTTGGLSIFAFIIVVLIIFSSKSLEKQSEKMTKTFTENLNEREQIQ